MAAVMGYAGYITATTSTAGSAVRLADMDSWSLNPKVNTVEVTAFSTSGWESHKPTIKSWAATCSGTLNRSSQQDQMLNQLEDGTMVKVKVRMYIAQTTAGDKYWNGGAIVESWSLDSKVKDKVGLTFNLKGSGALTYTTTTN